MAKSLIILPEAEQDITEAYNWYQERELGLGEEFLRCIDASIQTIKRNPEITKEEIEKILEFLTLIAIQTVSNYKKSI